MHACDALQGRKSANDAFKNQEGKANRGYVCMHKYNLKQLTLYDSKNRSSSSALALRWYFLYWRCNKHINPVRAKSWTLRAAGN